MLVVKLSIRNLQKGINVANVKTWRGFLDSLTDKITQVMDSPEMYLSEEDFNSDLRECHKGGPMPLNLMGPIMDCSALLHRIYFNRDYSIFSGKGLMTEKDKKKLLAAVMPEFFPFGLMS